jgi:hypothetical protein
MTFSTPSVDEKRCESELASSSALFDAKLENSLYKTRPLLMKKIAKPSLPDNSSAGMNQNTCPVHYRRMCETLSAAVITGYCDLSKRIAQFENQMERLYLRHILSMGYIHLDKGTPF